MIDSIYQHPGEALFASFLFGTVAGLLIAVVIIWVIWTLEQVLRYREKLARARQEPTARVAPLVSDEDHMPCAICWEKRHPGLSWGFKRRTLCMEHLTSELGPAQEEYQEYALQHGDYERKERGCEGHLGNIRTFRGNFYAKTAT